MPLVFPQRDQHRSVPTVLSWTGFPQRPGLFPRSILHSPGVHIHATSVVLGDQRWLPHPAKRFSVCVGTRERQIHFVRVAGKSLHMPRFPSAGCP